MCDNVICFSNPMNMFKPMKAKTVKEYLDAVPPERKELVNFLHEFIQKTVPSLKPYFAANMIGYGTFPYLNSKKQWVEWQTIGLANQKQHVSLYVCAMDGDRYVAEAHKKELGKVTVGKSCISIKNLKDVHLETLKKVLKAAEKNPGLMSAAQKKRNEVR